MWGLCGSAGRGGSTSFETRCITRKQNPRIFSARSISRFVPAQIGLLLKGIRKILQLVNPNPVYHVFMQFATTITSHLILFVPFHLLDFYNWSRYLFLSLSVYPVYFCSLLLCNSPTLSYPNRRLTHYCELYMKSNLPSQSACRCTHWLTLFYKALLGLSPLYLCTSLQNPSSS